MLRRIRLAWEMLTTGDIWEYRFEINRLLQRVKIQTFGSRKMDLSTWEPPPEELPFPHTGPTRTSFD